MFQDILHGSTAAMAVMPLIGPAIYRKNCSQGAVLPENTLRAHYKGVLGLSFSFVPTVVLQTSVKGLLSHDFDPFPSAVAAGGVSALVVCPAEGVMIQQQKTKVGYEAALKTLINRGAFFRGLSLTIAREGSFAGAYLGAAPILKQRFEERGASEGVAQLTAGLVAGVVAAAIGQPCDTLKTRVQGNLSLKVGLWEGLTSPGIMKGLRWRLACVVIATTLMPFIQEKL